MKWKVWFVGVMIGIVYLPGCMGSIRFPPRLPDGSLNLQALIDDVSWGVQIPCPSGTTSKYCTIAYDVIANARAALKSGLSSLESYIALRKSLLDSVATWPVIDPEVRWLITLLNAAITGPAPPPGPVPVPVPQTTP